MHSLRAKYLPASLKDGLQRATLLALAGSVSLVLVSIWASQRLLEVAILGALWLWWRKEARLPRSSPILLPLTFFFLWTVLAAIASWNNPPGITTVQKFYFFFTSIKKFYIFLILLLVPFILKGKNRTTRIYHAVFLVSALSSAASIVQFLANPNRDLMNRISGFMSHWMTNSGMLMLVLVALAAYAVCFGLGRRGWVIPLGLLLAAALILSLTRNAWLGALAGLTVVFLLRRPRAVLVLTALMVVLMFFSPPSIERRIKTGLDPDDPNTRNRIELYQTSLRLIRDNPWFGVGPKNVGREALRYRGTNEYPDWLYQHMHNNFLQIAAERGIPGLVLWLWFMARLAWDAIRVFRSARRSPEDWNENAPRRAALFVSIAALGAWTALLIAGLFEYNFGDSEVLTLSLFLMSTPYAYLSANGTDEQPKPSP